MKSSINIYSETIVNRLLKGIGAGFLGHVLSLVSRLVLPPMFLKIWGVDLYGEWLILTSFAAYLTLTDMGGQVYIVNRMTQAVSRNDIETFRKVLHSGMAVFLLWPAIVFFLFSIAVTVFPITTWFHLNATEHNTAAILLTVLAFQLVFFFPQGILIGVYRAIGQLPRGVMLGNAFQLFQFVFVAAGLKLGAGMVSVAILQTIPYFIIVLFAALDLNKRFPELNILSLKYASKETGKSFIKPSLHFCSIQISYALSIQGTVIVVGILLGAAQTVIFSTIRTLSNAIKLFLSLLSHTAWPDMTRLDAEHSFRKLYLLFRSLLRSTLVAATFVVIALHFFGEDIYNFWLKGRVEYRQDIMDLFLIYVLQQVFWTVCSNLLMAINVHQVLSVVMLLSSLLAVFLSFCGGYYYGLKGLVIGMMAGDLLLPLWLVPYLMNRYNHMFSFLFFARETLPIVVAIAGMYYMKQLTPIIILLLTLWWLYGMKDISKNLSSVEECHQKT